MTADRSTTDPSSRSAREQALDAVATHDVVDWWATAVSDIEPGSIRLRGYRIQDLIDRAS